jgi:hypothetical protein
VLAGGTVADGVHVLPESPEDSPPPGPSATHRLPRSLQAIALSGAYVGVIVVVDQCGTAPAAE